MKDYYRLSKPGIIYGNMITAIAGYLLACSLHIKWLSFLGLVIGLSLVIGSACVFNNLYDRDIDAVMERTKKRPSVTGRISTRSGIIFGSLIGISGFTILGLFTNTLTLMVAALGFVVYVTAYTYSKRRTHWSTLIGSVSGATPIVAGYTAFSGRMDPAALIIGLMMLVWQMPHFYAIAIYRDKDYRAAGIPSLPVVAGKRVTGYFMVFFSLAFLIFSVLLYVYANVGLVYVLVMGSVSLFWLGLNISGSFAKSIDAWAKRSFRSSLMVMMIMSLAIGLR